MKIPVEWLKQYIDTTKSSQELAKSFTALGLMLDKPISEFASGNYKTDVLDLEHRMDRSDWLSITGCARDLAAFEGSKFKAPDLYTEAGKDLRDEEKIKIDVKCPEMVNRFNTRIIKNVRVGESPGWLKNRLQAYGIPSINNIVDITNYVMVELGQPMHAQDIAKMAKPEIIIRRSKVGEKITTLLGETITLDDQCFVLTQNDIPSVLGGIVGGKATGIDKTTKDIVIDAGNYNQTVIRKSSRRLKILNETVSRYDKYLNPDLTEIALQRATKLILELVGGHYYMNQDWYPNPVEAKKFLLRYERLEKLSGMVWEPDKVSTILTSLGYVVLNENDKFFEVRVPYFRTDIEVEDDIVADILRINDYQNIPTSQLETSIPKDITTDIYRFEEKLRDIIIKLGGHEHITEPLTRTVNTKQVVLENVQSSDKSALRNDIYTTLIPVIDQYKRNGFDRVFVFEIGKTYAVRTNENPDYSDFEEHREMQVVVWDSAGLVEQSLNTKGLLYSLGKELGIEFSVKKTEDIYRIFSGETELGEMRVDGFRIRLQELMMEDLNMQSRAVTKLSYMYSNDISILMNPEQRIGVVCDMIRKSSSDIVGLYANIAIVEGKKNALITLQHNAPDFSELKNKLKNEIEKNFEGITFRS